MPADEDIVRGIREGLFADPETNVFAVLDGASVPDLPQELWEREPEHVCLYRGQLDPDMAATAPYLVRLEDRSAFTDWVLTQGWGKHWGVFAITPPDADLRSMRLHLRRFLMVKGPDGEQLYFRYYDPRVLRVYLPTCDGDDLDIVCGPVRAYVMEAEEPDGLVRYVRDGDVMVPHNVTLGKG